MQQCIPLQFDYNYLSFIRFLLFTKICEIQINFENLLCFFNPVVKTNKIKQEDKQQTVLIR